jgi:hypothetical protein
MKITVKIGLLFAALWIAAKMIFYITAPTGYSIVPLVLLNMLFLISAISIGMFLLKRKEQYESNALSDIKNGMTAGVPYAVIVSIFIYTYYAKIDPEYNAHQKAEWETTIKKELAKPGGLEQARESNPDFEVLSAEEIFSKMKSGYESFYSPNSTMILSLLALILLSTLNSIFVTVIFRKIVFRGVYAPRPPNDEVIDSNKK